MNAKLSRLEELCRELEQRLAPQLLDIAQNADGSWPAYDGVRRDMVVVKQARNGDWPDYMAQIEANDLIARLAFTPEAKAINKRTTQCVNARDPEKLDGPPRESHPLDYHEGRVIERDHPGFFKPLN